MNDEVAELKRLLQFAYDNLALVGAGLYGGEYDFCLVCNEPEWKHAKNCEGIAWRKSVKEVLENS